MDIQLKDVANNKLVDALISLADLKDLPAENDRWNFDWEQLFKLGDTCFKIVLVSSPEIIEGLMVISVINDEMVYINNIESAPHNIGAVKKYDYVAGCLFAYACDLSVSLGKKGYIGYVSFDSKTKLIPLYKEKYGAMHVGGTRMFFEPDTGDKLINQYLKGVQ